MNQIPFHWFVVDKFYWFLGWLGGLIGSIKLVDISIAHLDRRLRSLKQ